MLLLCSCQSAPDYNSVISKNDGSFDINAVETIDPTVSSEAAKRINYQDYFQSSDKSVDFIFDIQETFSAEIMPIIEVAPHYLTEEDAKHVATVLFGTSEFYEAQPYFATVYSKEEIQEKIEKWSQYTSETSIAKLFGSPQNNAIKVVKDFIANYTQLMETAPDVKKQPQCLWHFQESWKYSYTAEQVEEENITISQDDEIRANVTYDGIPYRYTVSTRNESDYKYNMIFVNPDYGITPWNLDEMILQEKLCRDKVPSEQQVANTVKKASELLDKMNLGKWAIDDYEVQKIERGDVIDYKITVRAVPVFNGTAAVRMPQLSNLKSETTYASNYYLTDAQFVFSPDGTLLSFQLFSPVDITSVISEKPKVRSMDELLEIAKNHFILTDAYFYGLGGIMDEANQDIDCNVTINKMEYGLARVKVPNTDDRYYYIPSMVFVGDIEYSMVDTGEICFSDESITLLHLNAIDGSVIPLDNG